MDKTSQKVTKDSKCVTVAHKEKENYMNNKVGEILAMQAMKLPALPTLPPLLPTALPTSPPQDPVILISLALEYLLSLP